MDDREATWHDLSPEQRLAYKAAEAIERVLALDNAVVDCIIGAILQWSVIRLNYKTALRFETHAERLRVDEAVSDMQEEWNNNMAKIHAKLPDTAAFIVLCLEATGLAPTVVRTSKGATAVTNIIPKHLRKKA